MEQWIAPAGPSLIRTQQVCLSLCAQLTRNAHVRTQQQARFISSLQTMFREMWLLDVHGCWISLNRINNYCSYLLCSDDLEEDNEVEDEGINCLDH